jgi:hypothetical protein
MGRGVCSDVGPSLRVIGLHKKDFCLLGHPRSRLLHQQHKKPKDIDMRMIRRHCTEPILRHRIACLPSSPATR